MMDQLIANNRQWAAGKTANDPEYFRRLAQLQAQPFLWIGCADSRVPANEIIGLNPGEVFVHRNVANLAPAQDTNFLSVLQYAVEVLKIQAIIVCGHYGCGGVRASLQDQRLGLIDHWLSPIRDLAKAHHDEIHSHEGFEAQVDRLCELNVIEQVRQVVDNPFVTDAWKRGQTLSVHGWIYGLHDGHIRDLGVTRNRLSVAP